jgi:hypothetical protein
MPQQVGGAAEAELTGEGTKTQEEASRPMSAWPCNCPTIPRQRM